MKQTLAYADILIEAPCYLAYIWMAERFCKKYLGTSKRNELLFVIFSFSGWLLINMANRRYFILYIFFIMLSHVFFMVQVLLMFQGDWGKKFLAASILLAIVTFVRNFCASVLSCVLLFLWHTVKKIPEPVLNQWEGRMIEGASLLMAALFLHWASRRLISVFYCKLRKWYVTLVVPLLVIIVVFDMAGWGASNGIMVRSGGSMGLYYDQLFSYAEFCILSLLAIFAAGFYLFGMNRIYLEQKKSSRYHSQIAIYKMLEEQYSQSERLRHDMKNHIIALSGLFQNKEWEKMGNYLKNMEDNSLEAGGDITGNKAVDALLYQKRKWAEQENVKWECDVQIPKMCGLNEFDLCILFGNILDNALEACERLKHSMLEPEKSCFINIQARTVKKCFFLEVKNSMDKTEKYEEGFVSKKNLQEHGIGLLNVRDTVHRSNGVVNIEAENGIFVISILIPLNAPYMTSNGLFETEN